MCYPHSTHYLSVRMHIHPAAGISAENFYHQICLSNYRIIFFTKNKEYNTVAFLYFILIPVYTISQNIYISQSSISHKNKRISIPKAKK